MVARYGARTDLGRILEHIVRLGARAAPGRRTRRSGLSVRDRRFHPGLYEPPVRLRAPGYRLDEISAEFLGLCWWSPPPCGDALAERRDARGVERAGRVQRVWVLAGALPEL